MSSQAPSRTLDELLLAGALPCRAACELCALLAERLQGAGPLPQELHARVIYLDAQGLVELRGQYQAPLRSIPVSSWVYDLGILALWCLGGQPAPHLSGVPRHHDLQIQRMLRDLEPRLSHSEPAALTALLARMTAFEPHARPSGRELQATLQTLALGASGQELGSWAPQALRRPAQVIPEETALEAEQPSPRRSLELLTHAREIPPDIRSVRRSPFGRRGLILSVAAGVLLLALTVFLLRGLFDEPEVEIPAGDTLVVQKTLPDTRFPDITIFDDPLPPDIQADPPPDPPIGDTLIVTQQDPPPPKPPLRAPDTGTVSVSGAARAWLTTRGGESQALGTVPVGTYDLHVRFENGKEILRSSFITVKTRQHVQIVCNAEVENCR